MHLTRRHFLEHSLGASTLLAFGPVAPEFLVRAARAQSTPAGRPTVLVAVQLSGGNDGLNTVVPFEDDAYHKQRPTLRLQPNQVLKLDARIGFHPQLTAFRRLYGEGRLSLIHSVGYPNCSRDHDAALRDWHTARPEETAAQTGWLGRAIDLAGAASSTPLPGVFVGSIPPPFGLRTERMVVPTLDSLERWSAAVGGTPWERGLYGPPLAELAKLPRGGVPQPLLEFLQAATGEASSVRQRLEEVVRASSAGASAYPSFGLAQSLRTIAQLIRAEVGVRMYYAELGGGGIGGFDTHANQAANHGALLRQLSQSVAAFVDDLHKDGLLDQVLLMTFSEFGRTVAENGRRGTDHGAGAPVFLAGGKLKAGFHGTQPGLQDLDGGGLRFTTDFRQLYATVLERWLGFDSEAILGQKHPPLDLFTA